ncbi:MAG: hypothetical protein CL808_00540 [Citromicrobium sp.]|nr:hypothetical protein [Citromicrobium sp.]|tara:strand:+ start:167 stop:544 length:378 start_codon:yes stop_codon:yes gene_type:complete
MRVFCLFAMASVAISGAQAGSIATGPFYLTYEDQALQPKSDHAFGVIDDVVASVPNARIYACALDETLPRAGERLERVRARLSETVAERAELDVKAQCPEPVVAAVPTSVDETSLVLWIDLSTAG